MKEVFDALPRISHRGLVLLDTCFVIHCFEHHHEHELLGFASTHDLALTSFTVHELVRVVHKIKDKSVKERVRKFFKSCSLISVYEVPVVPGDWEAEKAYAASVDPYLASDVPDPSDAVLVAAAIASGSVVVTRDKHDLFTVVLQNYLHRWGLKVVKNLKDV